MRNLLVVMDFNMKRLDAMAAFNHRFLEECAKNDIHAHFILPTEPCSLVKDSLSRFGFDYTVFKNWRNGKDKTKKHNIKLAIFVIKIIMLKKIDLVAFHFCYESTAIIVSLASRALLSSPIIVWHQHVEIQHRCSLPCIVFFKQHFSKIRLLSYFVNKICPVSGVLKKQLLSRRVSESKITLIYNGIDLTKFEKPSQKNILFRDLGISIKTPLIAAIATLIPAKGIDYLLHAAKIVKQHYNTVKFIIVGEGPILANLKALSARLGISDNVYFAGRRNDVPEILNASNFLVQPSLKEALGYSILEAMAARRPVVATNVGGMPELVTHNINGFLVPPKNSEVLAEAILRLLKNEELAQRMGRRGREIIEAKFTLDKMLNSHFLVYENCLNKRESR